MERRKNLGDPEKGGIRGRRRKSTKSLKSTKPARSRRIFRFFLLILGIIMALVGVINEIKMIVTLSFDGNQVTATLLLMVVLISRLTTTCYVHYSYMQRYFECWNAELKVLKQGRIHDCYCRGRLGRGSNDLGRGSNDLGRGMLKYKLFNP